MFKYVKRISINKIDIDAIKTLENKLNKLKARNSSALFINVNSRWTSLPYSVQVANLINDFKKDKKIPVYTFGEETIFGPSLLVLLAGDYVYTDRHTMFGFYDFSRNKSNFKKFMDNKDVQIKLMTSGRHKIRLNPFEEFKEEDIQWMKNILVKQKECFVEMVKELRSDKLKADWADLMNNDIFFGPKAENVGLVDGCESVESILMKKFPNKKIKNAKFGLSPSDYINLFTNTHNISTNSDIDLDIDELVSTYETEYMSQVVQNSLKNNLLI
jgi:ClpP class serine protease